MKHGPIIIKNRWVNGLFMKLSRPVTKHQSRQKRKRKAIDVGFFGPFHGKIHSNLGQVVNLESRAVKRLSKKLTKFKKEIRKN